MKVLGYSAKTAYYYKKIQGYYPDWEIRYKLKCANTEAELTKFLKESTLINKKPIAIISKEQFSGIGQKSRRWLSPKGGIWLSAAYPIFSENFSNNMFPLSIAIKLCEMLHSESIEVHLKWPNDIFFGSKKLIGFLPRIITRGKETIYVRIGLGMNFLNKTPQEGISLSEILKTKQICEYYWTARILQTINESINCNNKNEYIIDRANKYLIKKYLPKEYSFSDWIIKDIDKNGNLRIFNNTQHKIIKVF